ncbi:MAG: alpha-L-fucosidase [Chloroflexi bacterium]|nr:alpha-L-fucosidase [Chloroflexota bacterium]
MLQPAPTQGDTSWFVHDRFGMFIHWGLYALAARHEWVKNREEIDDATYQKYFEHFNPDLYDPTAWARTAREAGMKYMVITTKHHEGFCLWDSKLTNYKATKTPYGKDLLWPLVEAFRAEGLRIGFYYSLIDWHHPEFPIDAVHPQRNHPDAPEINKTRDIRTYTEYLHGQTRELLTEYGQVDIMWFDFSYPHREWRGMPGKGHEDWQSEKLLKMVRELQPRIMVDNRLDLPPEMADVHTPEQYQPRSWFHVNGQPVVWEACQTFSGSWGYHRDEASWKSPEQLIQMLVNTVSCGGNLLMNVGPTARGTFDQRALKALGVYRDWMHIHARSIYGCTQSPFPAPLDCRYTQNGNRLYLHIFNWPFRRIHLEGLSDRIEYVQLLNDASEVPFKRSDDIVYRGNTSEVLPPGLVTLELPVQKPDVVVPVVEIFLK